MNLGYYRNHDKSIKFNQGSIQIIINNSMNTIDWIWIFT